MSSSQLGFKYKAQYNDTGNGYTIVTDRWTREGSYSTNMIPVLDGAAMTSNIGKNDYALEWCDRWVLLLTQV